MALTVFEIEQSEQWDNIVRSFEKYDVYWLSGYVKAFKIHGDGKPLLFYYEDIDVRGINVVMKRDIALDNNFKGKIEKDTYYDFATPYGYGGWIIEGEKTNALFEAYDNWCKGNGIVSEFVRFHPVIKNHSKCKNSYEIVKLGQVVLMDLSSPEVIWENLTSKNRNMIRKAIKNDIKIYNGRYPDIFEDFRKIYNATMLKNQAEEYYYFSSDFYDSVCDDLAQNAQVFYAVLGEKVIAASIMIMANGMMNYHLSGSDKEYANLAPTNLILYQAALWGSANGYKSLYLGGGVGSGEDSLFKFKKAFYRQDDLLYFYIGKKIYDYSEYEELLSYRDDISDECFFPKYRG